MTLGLGWLACGQQAGTQLVLPPAADASSEAWPLADAEADGPDAEEAQADVVETGTTVKAPVVVAMEPKPRTGLDGGTAAAAELDAVLLSLALGARGLTLSRSWAELEGDGSESVWARIEAVGSLLRSQKRMMMLTVRVVDTTLDGRPAQLRALPWSAPAVTASLHQLIDALYGKLGVELRYLSLGFEVDAYVQANGSAGQEFLAVAEEAVRYASTHDGRPQSVQVAVTWSHLAWQQQSTPAEWAAPLVEASSAVLLTYAPLQDTLRPGPLDSVETDLAGLLAVTEPRPVVFANVSYPSSDLIASGEQQQAQFLELVLAQAEFWRQRVAFLGVSALHDPEPQECLERAAAQGHPGSEVLYAYWCSTGLHTREGVAKAGFEAFRNGAARLLEP